MSKLDRQLVDVVGSDARRGSEVLDVYPGGPRLQNVPIYCDDKHNDMQVLLACNGVSG